MCREHFEWQLKKVVPLTDHALGNMQQKDDLYGHPFVVGDQVLTAVLMDKAGCCGYRNNMVTLHLNSLSRLEEEYRYYTTKLGIPRFVRRT